MMVTAMILAGGAASTDPLLQHLGVSAKSLIKISNKEMLYYIVEALVGSGHVQRLLIVGLAPNAAPGLAAYGLSVEYVPDRGGLVSNTLAGVERLLGESRVLFCTADIPLLSAEIVRGFFQECAPLDADIYYPVVERSIMEARFPGSGRTFVRLRDGAFAGGDMSIVNPKVVWANHELMGKLTEARKNALHMVRLLGLGMIWRFLTRQLTVAQAERKAEQIFGCKCKTVRTRYAEIGMDVDKLPQLEMVRADMERGRG